MMRFQPRFQIFSATPPLRLTLPILLILPMLLLLLPSQLRFKPKFLISSRPLLSRIVKLLIQPQSLIFSRVLPWQPSQLIVKRPDELSSLQLVDQPFLPRPLPEPLPSFCTPPLLPFLLLFQPIALPSSPQRPVQQPPPLSKFDVLISQEQLIQANLLAQVTPPIEIFSLRPPLKQHQQRFQTFSELALSQLFLHRSPLIFSISQVRFLWQLLRRQAQPIFWSVGVRFLFLRRRDSWVRREIRNVGGSVHKQKNIGSNVTSIYKSRTFQQ